MLLILFTISQQMSHQRNLSACYHVKKIDSLLIEEQTCLRCLPNDTFNEKAAILDGIESLLSI